jgi:hypothetical protein
MTEPNLTNKEQLDKLDSIEESKEPDLLDEIGLKTLLLQYNPQVSKDIIRIEKGVENYFLFNGSVYALAKIEDLKFFTQSDIQMLADKKAIVRFQYLEYSDELKDLILRKVIIRPSSLKIELVKKIKKSCAIETSLAILKFLAIRDRLIQEKITSNEIEDYTMRRLVDLENGEWIDISKEKSFPLAVKSIDSISFDYQMECLWLLDLELISQVLKILTKADGVDYNEIFSTSKMSEDQKNAIINRGGFSLLQEITRDFHIIRPCFSHMVKMEGELIIPTSSELEAIHQLMGQIAKNILIQLLPIEQSMGFSTDKRLLHELFLQELEKHASFSSQGGWEGAESFLAIYKNINAKVANIKEIRNEYMVDVLLKNKLTQLNMRFEPILLTQNEFSVDPEFAKHTGLDKNSLFNKFLEKCKNNLDLVYHIERRAGQSGTGIHLMYKENLPKSFISYKKKRIFLNAMAKESNIKNGIYEFLKEIPLNVLNREQLLEEQLQLSKAVSEWEDDLEEERIKKEKKEKGIILVFLEWLAALFGINYQKRRETDRSEKKKKTSVIKQSVGVLGGPKEREIVIPSVVQKAIDFVDRKNRGFIWLDEIFAALKSSQYSINTLADMLFFDKQRRYLELRALNGTRHIFVRKELENDKEWLENSINYLENITQKRVEHLELINELQKMLKD